MFEVKEFNIVLAGVGGQGTLLAAEILGTAAVKDELNVRVSEIHGMAQRGGAVVSTVRIGDAVRAPTVIDGQADVLLGFEPLETLRNLKYASRKTLVIMNSEEIPPAGLAAKNLKYPGLEEVKQKISRFTEKIIVVDAAQLAEEAGSSLAQNSVLVGALAAVASFPVKLESVVEALKQLVPAKYVEANVKAFQLGYGAVKKEMVR
ncbi:indolepyruvate ferredoxin oxidoreductase subunit beta [Candidatus Bathyarchaeota archaeon]|nr:indolepyruvate ferredoxin oxidoreductase subunit beta [Candidatus Bathyarchaeota archaeon]